jgi:hypothetical protein
MAQTCTVYVRKFSLVCLESHPVLSASPGGFFKEQVLQKRKRKKKSRVK